MCAKLRDSKEEFSTDARREVVTAGTLLAKKAGVVPRSSENAEDSIGERAVRARFY